MSVITFRVELALGTFRKTESSNLWKSSKKKNLRPMLHQDRLDKKSGGCFGSKRRDSESSADMYRQNQHTNDCVMISERSALVRGAGPP